MSACPVEIDVNSVKQKLDDSEPLLLLDCRREDEYAVARIDSAMLIPMHELPNRVEQLGDPQQPVIVYCHHGSRSLMVAEWLRQQGFRSAQSMSGGIDAWSLVIDNSVPRYT